MLPRKRAVFAVRIFHVPSQFLYHSGFTLYPQFVTHTLFHILNNGHFCITVGIKPPSGFFLAPFFQLAPIMRIYIIIKRDKNGKEQFADVVCVYIIKLTVSRVVLDNEQSIVIE